MADEEKPPAQNAGGKLYLSVLRDEHFNYFLAMLPAHLCLKVYQPKVYATRYFLAVLVRLIPSASQGRIADVLKVRKVLRTHLLRAHRVIVRLEL